MIMDPWAASAVRSILILFLAGGASSVAWSAVELDASGVPGSIRVRGTTVLRAGETLVISPYLNYNGRNSGTHRPVRAVFDADLKSSLTVQSGATLIVSGESDHPIEFVTDPPDPRVKGLLSISAGAKAELRNVSFINIALRIEGGRAALSHVSVQYGGDQPAFTFAGATGDFDHLFAHHCTWGFSLTSLHNMNCRITLRDSMVRSCAKGSPGSTYESGGALQAVPDPGGVKQRLDLIRVDWDPSWDRLRAAEVHVSGSRPRIVAMGDSIAQGCCKYVNFWNYLPGNDDIEHSWPYNLQQRTSDFFVINKAEGGFVTGQMLAALPAIIERVLPSYCYLGGGTNDLGADVPAGTVVRNFQSMWSMLKAAGITAVQLAITPTTKYPERESSIVLINSRLREASAAAGVRFEDVYTLLASKSGPGLDKAYDPGDGLHLNKAGYRKIATFLWVPHLQSSRRNSIAGFHAEKPH